MQGMGPTIKNEHTALNLGFAIHYLSPNDIISHYRIPFPWNISLRLHDLKTSCKIFVSSADKTIGDEIFA